MNRWYRKKVLDQEPLPSSASPSRHNRDIHRSRIAPVSLTWAVYVGPYKHKFRHEYCPWFEYTVNNKAAHIPVFATWQ